MERTVLDQIEYAIDYFKEMGYRPVIILLNPKTDLEIRNLLGLCLKEGAPFPPGLVLSSLLGYKVIILEEIPDFQIICNIPWFYALPKPPLRI